MKTIPLPCETRELTGFSHILRFTAADFAAYTSGTAQAVHPENTLGSTTNQLPTDMLINRLALRVVNAAVSSGGTISTLTLSVGDSASGTQFLTTTDLKTAGYTLAASTTSKAYAAADYIKITPAITGQTLASLTTCDVDIYVNLVPIGELNKIR